MRHQALEEMKKQVQHIELPAGKTVTNPRSRQIYAVASHTMLFFKASDRYLRRFLTARDYVVEEAVEMFKNCMEVRWPRAFPFSSLN